MLKLNFPVVLASKSPRRHELLKLMGIDFSVELKDVDESYPSELNPADVALYISEKKASAFTANPDVVVITADTIVAIDGEILGKPADHEEAAKMLTKLSGNHHEVFTGVSINHKGEITSFYDCTKVKCRLINEEEIAYYIEHFKPFDKAGSYGIQDWFGLTVVEEIRGSYTNVMGLPTEKLYQYLSKIS